MKKVIFIFTLALGFAWNCHAQTWTYVQDSVMTNCTGGSSTCNLFAGNILPTTSGTVWVLRIHTPNNTTITSVTGGGGTWQLCPASSCHLFNSTKSDNQDLAYNLSGNAGTTNITVTISSAAGAFWGGNFMEILPPPGSTASFDTAGTVTNTSCTTCTGVGLTLSATDAVIQSLSGTGAAKWNAWSAPYFTDQQSNGIGLNLTSGTAPTVNISGTAGDFTAIAFKSSLGSFTPPNPGSITLVNYTELNRFGGTNCSPSCSITIPSTGSGHLLYVQSGSITGSFISSVSGGGAGWVVPSGANTCRAGSGGTSLSCAYLLSSAAGATSLSITMTANATVGFTVSELASTSPFTFDVQGSTTNSPSVNPSGQALTLTGTNDVVFQAIAIPGGTSGVTYYPLPLIGIDFFNTNSGFAMALNVSSAPVPLWADEQNNTTVVSGVAFRTGTAPAPPAPPTGLAAVVN